jgi:hypothetical protein
MGYGRFMNEILVTSLGADLYRVEVKEGDSKTIHDVTVGSADLTEFGRGYSPQTLLEESFRFLLEREPKEAILPRFDLPVIARYFPDYPAEITRRLAGH